MRFRDKVIWITGAASGIGEALAYQAADYGAKLVLSDIDRNNLKRVGGGCRKINTEVLELPLDLAKREELEKAASSALKHYGYIDVLINNGGISQRSMTWDTGLEVDYRIMDINFFAPVILTKLLLPSMMERGGGAIAVTSSITGKFGWPLRSAYAASKHAVQGFFETLGIELSDKGISVTIAMPGRVQTNISKHALTGDGSAHGKMDPGQAGGIPAEVCARKYLEAILKGKREVLIGAKELNMVHIRRFLPGLYHRLARRIEP